MMNLCKDCLTEYPLEYFRVDNNSTKGYRNSCRECRKIARLQIKDKINEQKRVLYRKTITDDRRLILNEKARKFYTRNYIGALLTSCKQRDNVDSVIDHLYIENLYQYQKGLCHYCKVKVDINIGNKYCNQISIDRIDSKKGYIENNIAITCLFCNYAKNNTDINHFLNFIQCIKTGHYTAELIENDKYWYQKLLSLIRQRDPDTDITKTWIFDQMTKQSNKCYYSGIEFVIASNPRYLYKPSIERIDNSILYTQANCVLVCLGINYGRSCTPLEIFYSHLNNIRIN